MDPLSRIFPGPRYELPKGASAISREGIPNFEELTWRSLGRGEIDRLFARDLSLEFPLEASPIRRSFKEIFHIEGNPRLIARVSRDYDSMSRAFEYVASRYLEEVWSIPTLPFYATGNYEGRPADIVARFDVTALELVLQPELALSYARYFDDGFLNQLDRIEKAFDQGLVIDDFELGIHERGVWVFDPHGIHHAEEWWDPPPPFEEDAARAAMELDKLSQLDLFIGRQYQLVANLRAVAIAAPRALETGAPIESLMPYVYQLPQRRYGFNR